MFDSELLEQIAEQLEERVSASDERMEALEICLKLLPGGLRKMAEERYQAGGSVRKIAEQRHTTPHAITMNLYRVRLMLRECVEKRLAAGGAHG